MTALRSQRVGLLLLLAVWQLLLPILAYAHLSKTGALTQEVCTSVGMKMVVLEASADADSSPADTTNSLSSTHECCVFHFNAPTSSAPVGTLAQAKPHPNVLPRLLAPRASIFLGLHAPPTGPPTV
jgi:hypothetical protein